MHLSSLFKKCYNFWTGKCFDIFMLLKSIVRLLGYLYTFKDTIRKPSSIPIYCCSICEIDQEEALLIH